MDAQSFQTRAMTRLGDHPTEGDLQHAFARLLGETSAFRSMVSLDRESWLTDQDASAHLGTLLVCCAEIGCVLGVDIPLAMQQGADAADARVTSRAAFLAERRAVKPGSV